MWGGDTLFSALDIKEDCAPLCCRDNSSLLGERELSAYRTPSAARETNPAELAMQRKPAATTTPEKKRQRAENIYKKRLREKPTWRLNTPASYMKNVEQVNELCRGCAPDECIGAVTGGR